MVIGELIAEMTEYFQKDPKRVGHFLKVYGFAKTIGECEGLDAETMEILQIAAVVHDIGIPESIAKYGSSAGKYQEMEGPEVAKELLERLECPEDVIERVCYLVGHHHTYRDIQGEDYQILVEADMLVNLYEDHESEETAHNLYEKIFRTKTGRMMLENQFFS